MSGREALEADIAAYFDSAVDKIKDFVGSEAFPVAAEWSSTQLPKRRDIEDTLRFKIGNLTLGDASLSALYPDETDEARLAWYFQHYSMSRVYHKLSVESMRRESEQLGQDFHKMQSKLDEANTLMGEINALSQKLTSRDIATEEALAVAKADIVKARREVGDSRVLRQGVTAMLGDYTSRLAVTLFAHKGDTKTWDEDNSKALWAKAANTLVASESAFTSDNFPLDKNSLTALKSAPVRLKPLTFLMVEDALSGLAGLHKLAILRARDVAAGKLKYLKAPSREIAAYTERMPQLLRMMHIIMSKLVTVPREAIAVVEDFVLGLMAIVLAMEYTTNASIIARVAYNISYGFWPGTDDTREEWFGRLVTPAAFLQEREWLYSGFGENVDWWTVIIIQGAGARPPGGMPWPFETIVTEVEAIAVAEWNTPLA